MLAERAVQTLSSSTPESVGLSTERLGRISRRLQAVIDHGDLTGAVTLVHVFVTQR
jgi:hypothetical protein